MDKETIEECIKDICGSLVAHEKSVVACKQALAQYKKSLAEAEKPKLDYSKPIIASSGESIYLLVANCNTNSYERRGYDWINIATGKFNSKYCWKTAEEAVKSYSVYEGKPHNVVFDHLAALAEDLRKCKVADIEMKITAIRSIGLYQDEDEVFIPPNALSTFILNLQRMEATMKRQENGKKYGPQ